PKAFGVREGESLSVSVDVPSVGSFDAPTTILPPPSPLTPLPSDGRGEPRGEGRGDGELFSRASSVAFSAAASHSVSSIGHVGLVGLVLPVGHSAASRASTRLRCSKKNLRSRPVRDEGGGVLISSV